MINYCLLLIQTLIEQITNRSESLNDVLLVFDSLKQNVDQNGKLLLGFDNFEHQLNDDRGKFIGKGSGGVDKYQQDYQKKR